MGARALSPVGCATLEESVFHFEVYLNTKAPDPYTQPPSLHLFIHMSVENFKAGTSVFSSAEPRMVSNSMAVEWLIKGKTREP